MKLILDTSSEKLKVILDKNSKVFENGTNNPKHLKNLLPEIDKVLSSAKEGLEDVSTFCVVLGPGSFTGVRIGVSTVKAFCKVLKNKKIIGINLLELLAFSICKSNKIKGKFNIFIKSTSTKYYYALCTKSGKIEKMTVLTLNEIDQDKEILSRDMYVYNAENVGELKANLVELSTKDYLDFINIKVNDKCYTSEKDLRPIYLALSQAEEELLKKGQDVKNN